MTGVRRERDLVVALSGGVGGAKLALGLTKLVAPNRLVVIANTGDDFEHLGLYISPDVDTLLYTLAGLNNPETGWGRREETWTFMAVLQTLGGETWFRLRPLQGTQARHHLLHDFRVWTGRRLRAIAGERHDIAGGKRRDERGGQGRWAATARRLSAD